MRRRDFIGFLLCCAGVLHFRGEARIAVRHGWILRPDDR